MIQIREVRLIGDGVEDAYLNFVPGGNVVAGDSDTGKSYILRCLDFVLGAEEMTKEIDEAKPYETVLVELQNSQGVSLTLQRHLTGGDVIVYDGPISKREAGQAVQWKRRGKSTAPDVTSVVFAFCGIKEAKLRNNAKGEVKRLSIRTLLPVFLVDEISIQAERSPLFGESGYDKTSRKRMFSFLLTGKDDAGVIAEEQQEIIKAELKAKLNFIDSLLPPLEERISTRSATSGDVEINSINRVDKAVARLSSVLAEDQDERIRLREERLEAVHTQHHAETQILAIGELVQRYRLLDQRYTSDLDRLDFVAEGGHFFKDLQRAQCPLCDQSLGQEHAEHFQEETVHSIYEAAKAEAAKINGHRQELAVALKNLEEVAARWTIQRDEAVRNLTQIDITIKRNLRPRLREAKIRLDELIQRRVKLESYRSDEDQLESLRNMRAELRMLSRKTPARLPKNGQQLSHQHCGYFAKRWRRY